MGTILWAAGGRGALAAESDGKVVVRQVQFVWKYAAVTDSQAEPQSTPEFEGF
jgi:hypothetical protein